MTEDIQEDLKQLEKEYPEGKWTTYAGLEANIKGNEFINNILSKMEEGQKVPLNGEPNTYAIKQDGKLLIVLPPKCVPNPDCIINIGEESRPLMYKDKEIGKINEIIWTNEVENLKKALDFVVDCIVDDLFKNGKSERAEMILEEYNKIFE